MGVRDGTGAGKAWVISFLGVRGGTGVGPFMGVRDGTGEGKAWVRSFLGVRDRTREGEASVRSIWVSGAVDRKREGADHIQILSG